jgi:hypothetical protein
MGNPGRCVRSSLRFSSCLAALALACSTAQAQTATAARKLDAVLGNVTALDAAARRLTLKPDSGSVVVVTLEEQASVLRAQPGAKTLTDASPVTFDVLAVGDRVLARGVLSEDKATLAARQLVLMTQNDIASKHDAEQADWRKRGVLGVVTAVDATKGEIALRVGRRAGGQPLTVATAGRSVVCLRYAPDSVKFDDARPSTLADVKVGDQLRALGNRNAEGTLEAERVVFGTFRTVSGAVTALDAAHGSVTLREEDSKRVYTALVGSDARLRHLSPEIGARMARMAAFAAGGAGPGEGQAPRTTPRTPPAEGEAPRWGAREGGAGGGEDVLERLPPTTLAELKVGDRILVASTEGSDPLKLNAIALVSGLETLAVAQPTGRQGRSQELSLASDLLEMGMGAP